MKKALGLLIAVLMGYSMQWFGLPEPPAPIQMQALTPAKIEQGIAAEHTQAAFIRDTVLAAQVYEAHGCDPWLAERTARRAREVGLPAQVVAADIVVESSCRANVVSSHGAVGLMQVEPKVWHVSKQDLMDPDFNMKVGTEVMAGYTHKYGMHEGLRHYLGTGTTDGSIDGMTYADRVLQVAYAGQGQR